MNQTNHSTANMKKVALTSLAGTSIEWYDFFLYGASAALIFPTVFFGETTPSTALILSLLTFAAGFIARPIGGIVFGHYGDKVGRKKTLVIALILMGISSTLIGLLPTYAMIGVTAPILLTILRFAQGLAIGGQWGGAMLLVTESAPANQRGYYGAFAQAGVPVGVILANLAFIVTSSLVSEESFFAWGWRIPFLASAILIGISMYIQLNLEDTKAFKELETSRKIGNKVEIKRSPIIEAVKKYPSKIVLAAGAFLSIQVTFYILIAFLLAYGVATTEVTRDHMLVAVLIGSGIMIPFQFFFSSYSDRY
jgi:MFS family permease